MSVVHRVGAQLFQIIAHFPDILVSLKEQEMPARPLHD